MKIAHKKIYRLKHGEQKHGKQKRAEIHMKKSKTPIIYVTDITQRLKRDEAQAVFEEITAKKFLKLLVVTWCVSVRAVRRANISPQF